MEIKDIIKSDSDRLFIVDPECYIIFTGETTDDIKPFIRIGNWNDMPVELIPLIENIIITDSLIGNPAHEQFNIDVRHLPENRYIGSKAVVRKYLDYQKIFGLDLTNASVVDIEKDLPELSKEKNISHKDQFIGVFYRDGNFKVLLNKNIIFDLNKIIEKPISWQKFHDLLSESNRGTARYNGSGLAVIGHNPFFYNSGHFYSYLFPADYLGPFSLLGIDPGKVQAILHPSLNLTNISKLFKWLNNTGRKITIFANSTDIDLVKRLFSHAVIRKDDFSGLAYRGDTGIEFRNYPGTFNMKITFSGGGSGGKDLTAAYIKGSAGVRDIIKEKPDLFIISYTAYEDIVMLLRSTDIPVVIIDDGNKHISRLGGEDKIVLSRGIQYEFRAFTGIEDLTRLSGLGDDIIARITGSPEELASETGSPSAEAMTPERRRELFNLLSLVRVHLYNTGDRKLSSQLRGIAGTLSLAVGRSSAVQDPSRHSVVLALFNGAVFPFVIDSKADAGLRLFDTIGPDGDSSVRPGNPGMGEYYDRIIADRERLRCLIDIYTRSERYHEKNMPEIGKLKDAIGERKSQYRDESLSLDNAWSRSIASSAVLSSDEDDTGTGAAAAVKGPRSGAAGSRLDADAAADKGMEGAGTSAPAMASSIIKKIKNLPAAVKIALPLGLILLIAAAVLLLRHPATEGTDGSARAKKRVVTIKAKGPVIESRDIDTRYRQLGLQLNIKIRDNDIYHYANEVAVRNGYHKIAETTLRERNPDWIYPENVFIMLDSQPVVVSRGDTLWNLSKNKLIESTIRFNELSQQYNAADAKNKARLIGQMKQFAYSKEQREALKKAEESLSSAARQVPAR
ncbi:MAG: hypothetical protein KA369_23685 [Spirochaetes bacterium]|nr:hypothetical protein [Spirochaetota bacterium]